MLHATVDRGRGISVGNNSRGARCDTDVDCRGGRNVMHNASFRHFNNHTFLRAGTLGSQLALTFGIGTTRSGNAAISSTGSNRSMFSTVGCCSPLIPIAGTSNS